MVVGPRFRFFNTTAGWMMVETPVRRSYPRRDRDKWERLFNCPGPVTIVTNNRQPRLRIREET